MRLKLLQRTLRHPQELNKRPAVFPAMTFSDIRRDRNSGASNLAGHAVNLLLRKISSQTICRLCHIDRLLPHLELSIRADPYFTVSFYSLFATHYSLPAISN